MVLSYEFERPYRKLSEHRQRDRSSDRASQATRPTFDMRLAPLKHWGGVFQRGPVGGVGGQIEALIQTDYRSVRSVPPRTRLRRSRDALGHSLPSSSRGVGLDATWHQALTSERVDAESEEEDELWG